MGMPEQEFEQLAARFRGNFSPLQQVSQMDVAKPAKALKPLMNKWESAFAMELEADLRAGKCRWWAFEPIKLRLADNTYYTPDFAVLEGSALKFYEVKGFWRDDARVKIKVAAEMFPFYFVGVTRERRTGEWKYEQFWGRGTR